MGLDYSYILYFSREKQWEALKAVVDIAEPHQPPVKITFPDHELSIALETWSDKNGVLRYDEPELDFHFSIDFEEDDAIQSYLRNSNEIENFRSLPIVVKPKLIPIGYIYLTIYNGNSEWFSGNNSENTVAFTFGTTGTRMSILFYESTSIRKKFVELLERVPGICGVFNLEERGELFWYKGQSLAEGINDPYMLPDEIEATLH